MYFSCLDIGHPTSHLDFFCIRYGSCGPQVRYMVWTLGPVERKEGRLWYSLPLRAYIPALEAQCAAPYLTVSGHRSPSLLQGEPEPSEMLAWLTGTFLTSEPHPASTALLPAFHVACLVHSFTKLLPSPWAFLWPLLGLMYTAFLHDFGHLECAI